jgi:hypothetical protein
MSPRYLLMIGRRAGEDFDRAFEGPLAYLVRGFAPDDPLAGQNDILAVGQHPVSARRRARPAHAPIPDGSYGASLRTALKSVQVQPVCRSSVCVKRIR